MKKKLLLSWESLFDRWRVTKSESESHSKLAIYSALSIATALTYAVSNWLIGTVLHLVGVTISSTVVTLVALVLFLLALYILQKLMPRHVTAKQSSELRERIKHGGFGFPTSLDTAEMPKTEIHCPWCGYNVCGQPLLQSEPTVSICSECGDLVHRRDITDMSRPHQELLFSLLTLPTRADRSRALLSLVTALAIVAGILLFGLLKFFRVNMPFSALNFNWWALVLLFQPVLLFLHSAYWTPRIRAVRQLLIRREMGGEK